MLNTMLIEFYERDITQLIEEVNSFKNETDLWRTEGTIKNSSGNLVLHIIGGMKHHIGATLAKTGYVRNREQEFQQKNVPKDELIAGLRDLIELIKQTLGKLSATDMEADFPAFFDRPGTSVQYVLIQLSLHLNYHRGQVNYLRRLLM